jgi:hypothetical protein
VERLTCYARLLGLSTIIVCALAAPVSAQQVSASSGLQVSIDGVSIAQDNAYDYYVIRTVVTNTRSDSLYALFSIAGEVTSDVGTTARVDNTTGFASCSSDCRGAFNDSVARESYQFLERGVPASLVIKAVGLKSRGTLPDTLSFVLKFVVRTAGATEPLDAASRPMGPAVVVPINFVTVPITKK